MFSRAQQVEVLFSDCVCAELVELIQHKPWRTSLPICRLVFVHARQLQCDAMLAVLILLLASTPFAPVSYVVCRRPLVTAAHADPTNHDLTLLTYHGPVEGVGEALPEQILLHVFVKAKQQADGSFLVRTVSYAERSELSGMPAACFAAPHLLAFT